MNRETKHTRAAAARYAASARKYANQACDLIHGREAVAVFAIQANTVAAVAESCARDAQSATGDDLEALRKRCETMSYAARVLLEDAQGAS